MKASLLSETLKVLPVLVCTKGEEEKFVGKVEQLTDQLTFDGEVLKGIIVNNERV